MEITLIKINIWKRCKEFLKVIFIISITSNTKIFCIINHTVFIESFKSTIYDVILIYWRNLYNDKNAYKVTNIRDFERLLSLKALSYLKAIYLCNDIIVAV